MAGMSLNNSNFAVYGYEFKRSKKIEDEKRNRESFVGPDNVDGSLVLESNSIAGGFFGHALDLDARYRSEQDLIRKYREISKIADVDAAIDDIVNESIVTDNYEAPVTLFLDDYIEKEHGAEVKDQIHEEFDRILKLLRFNTKGYEFFRRWYVDGKIYFHKIINEKNPKDGIRELRQVDPMHMRKVKEVEKVADENGVEKVKILNEYYMFNEHGWTGNLSAGLRISPDAICYVPSGLYDYEKKINIGHLYKVIKPANQLRMMEDAVVIYRIARAPERRVFYIDTGGLPKTQAEKYVRNLMHQYRNKLVYDASTGELRDDKRHMSMLEDFWMPRREGSQGTQIETLNAGQNLGEIEDVQYFQKKLYKSLNVPLSRLETDTGFSLGRASEITRDELKFGKFVDRIRTKFSELFFDLLKTQLILKGIISPEEWDGIKQYMFVDYRRDSHFTELKETELIENRLRLLRDAQEYQESYFSKKWVMEKVLRLSNQEIEELAQQREEEAKENPESSDDENDQDEFGGRF